MSFGRIRAHRGDDENAVVIDTTWTDIANRFVDSKLKVASKFGRINKIDVKCGSLSTTLLSEDKFVQAVAYICDTLGGSFDLEKGSTMKVTKTVVDDEVQMKIKFYEDEEGTKHAEFIKKEGLIMSFHALTGDITEEFNKL